MCRGCLFVVIDEPSGDIDGCRKQDVIEELRSKNRYRYMNSSELAKVLDEAEKAVEDEDHCMEELKQEDPETPEEFKRQWKEWWDAREKAIQRYHDDLLRKAGILQG